MGKQTKKSKGERLPSYRLHKPSGQGVVTLSGKDHYCGPFDKQTSKRRYQELVAQWLANDRQALKPTRSPHASDDDALTVAELCLKFLTFAREHYQKNGEHTSESKVIERSLRPVVAKFGALSVNDFGPNALRNVRDHLVGTGLARTTVNIMVAKIKRMYRWAVSREIVRPEAAYALGTVEGLKRGRTTAREPKPTRPAPAGWLEAVVPHCTEPVGSLLVVQRRTGMRIGELLQMTPEDIDRSGAVWWYVPKSHKTEYMGRERRIAIGPQAQEALSKLLDGCPPTRRVFTWRKGKGRGRPIKISSLCEHVKSACAAAGVEYYRCHSLRHARLTEVRARLGIEHAQATGGHASADMTEHYARLTDAKAAEAAQAGG